MTRATRTLVDALGADRGKGTRLYLATVSKVDTSGSIDMVTVNGQSMISGLEVAEGDLVMVLETSGRSAVIAKPFASP